MKQEKERAQSGGAGGGAVNPKAERNIHLLDDVCFIPMRRQEHEVRSICLTPQLT